MKIHNESEQKEREEAHRRLDVYLDSHPDDNRSVLWMELENAALFVIARRNEEARSDKTKERS